MGVFKLLIKLTAICCLLATRSTTRNRPCLFVGSFNVKWFTVTKSANENILNTIADIVLRYDVMLMMEIRDDVRQTAMNRLWEIVNLTSPYGLSLSQRLGRRPSRYSEQYGFFHRADKAYVIDTFQYDDSVYNEFEREPYSVLIKTSTRSSLPGTAFIGLHTKPTNTVQEMANMVEVTNSILQHWNTARAVVLGDMNADCKYMPAAELEQTPLLTDPRFTWLILDTADTTVSPDTDCAYDRIIVTDSVKHMDPSVFNFKVEYGMTFEDARAVSDHFPVEARIC